MLLRARRGQAAAELALALPVLMILALGVIDVGRVMNTSASLRRGVSAGARMAMSATIADTAVTSTVTAAASPTVPASVTITRAGDSVVVTATASVSSMTPAWHLIWASSSVPLSSTAVARVAAP